jgi:hypothetical protein
MKHKANSYPKEILDGFKAVENEKGMWVIQLAEHRYLHWIEATNDKPCTVNRPDMPMIQYNFKEEAEGIIDWLRKRWSQDPSIEVPKDETITVQVPIESVLAKQNKPRQTASGN